MNEMICSIAAPVAHVHYISYCDQSPVTILPRHDDLLYSSNASCRRLESIQAFIVRCEIRRIEGWHGQSDAFLIPCFAAAGSK